jgi:hypothetical protein
VRCKGSVEEKLLQTRYGREEGSRTLFYSDAHCEGGCSATSATVGRHLLFEATASNTECMACGD